MQAFDKLGLDRSRGHRADVQQKVGVVTRGSRQILNELRRAFEVLVIFVVAPGVADRVACLERQLPDY